MTKTLITVLVFVSNQRNNNLREHFAATQVFAQASPTGTNAKRCANNS